MSAIVAIIGRPNVGKSTLFNRIAGKRKALVHHLPGTTRDYNETMVTWNGTEFVLVDTGGWDLDFTSFLSKEVKKQMQSVLESAQVVVFIVDGKEGQHPLDVELSKVIRKHTKKTILVVNKIDTLKDESKTLDFYALGLEDLLPISANHGRNIHELMDKITEQIGMSEKKTPAPEIKSIYVTLVGKPNVGKSTLFNKLYKKERNIVSDVPGTTREAVDISLARDNQDFILIDTPGLHRKRTFKDDLDYLSDLSAQKALERTNIAVLIIDAQLGIGETDSKIAELILKNNCACLIAINKWDSIEDREEQIKILNRQLEKNLKFISWAKVMYISAKTGQRTERIFQEVKTIYKEYARIIPKKELNQFLEIMSQRRTMSRSGQAIKIKEIFQSFSKPPCFTLVVNKPELFHFSNKRFIENGLREHFGFHGTPILIKLQRPKGEAT